MKFVLRHLGLIAATFFAQQALAYDLPTALANLADDYADCVAYYSFTVQMATSMNRPKEAEEFQKTTDHALQLYLVAMNDKTQEQLKTKAKLELHLNINTRVLKEEGMDRLILKYSGLCKSLMEDPND
jgi:hypothetical protein